ncbi:hypothetical protein HKD37_14G040582 [Glycine soja]
MRGNSPRRACNLGLKESARPGELDASLGKFMARNLHEMTILPFLKALFLDPSNNYKKPTKSRMNLSYLSNNITQALGNQNRGETAEAAKYQWLDYFQRNNPPAFNGGYNPDGAHNWIREIEKIFRVMACLEGKKVAFGTYTLVEEAEYWWENTCQCLEAKGQVVTWEIFKRVFLEKYFPEDVRNKKEMEFLELKQGNMTVVEYAAKFKEIMRYIPHYQGRDGESSKCVKFLNGLRPKVKQAMNYQGVFQFPLFDEDSRDREAYCRSTSPMKNKKNGPQNQGKPYPTPRKQHGNHPNNQRTVATRFIGGSGRKPTTFKTHVTCYKCGKPGHISSNCNSGGLNDQTRRPKATGRVFTLTGAKASKSKDLIQGKCFTSGIPSLVLFDSGETYSFTSYLCVEKLKLSMSSLNKDLVVETPTNGFVLTSNVCLNCPVEIFGRTFFIDLE